MLSCAYRIARLMNGDNNTIFLTKNWEQEPTWLPSFYLTGVIFSLRELWLPCSRVFIFTDIGIGNGSFLVMLDLSTAFDTIDHDTLFMILEKFVGISGSALELITSYFSDRTQRVVIDGILS